MLKDSKVVKNIWDGENDLLSCECILALSLVPGSLHARLGGYRHVILGKLHPPLPLRRCLPCLAHKDVSPQSSLSKMSKMSSDVLQSNCLWFPSDKILSTGLSRCHSIYA